MIDHLSTHFGITLPEDYVAFLRKYNGGEGFVGDNYVIFWKADELADFNREYEVEKYAPNHFSIRVDRRWRRLWLRY